MTSRKPFDMTWTSWIDRQIEDARSKAFDHLPGHGKPIVDPKEGYDPDWWIKEKVKAEKLDLTQETILARKAVEDWMSIFLDMPSEARVRRQAEALNQQIAQANKTHLGPLLPQKQLDIDALCSEWRVHNHA